MQLTVDRSRFAAVYAMAAQVASGRHTSEAYTCVSLTAGSDCLLEATDGEVSISVNLDAPADKLGAVLLPPLFGQILREASDARVHLRTEDDKLHVTAGAAHYELPTIPADQFPSLGNMVARAAIRLNSAGLCTVIRRTAFVCDTANSRYALGGVKIEAGKDRIHGIATDGRRMSVAEAPAIVDGDWGDTIIPQRALHLAEKTLAAGEITLRQGASEVSLSSQHVTIRSRLVEGRFPRWRDVLPKPQHNITAIAGPFAVAVNQARVATNDESRGVVFRFANGRCVMSGKSQRGTAQAECPVPFDGNVPITLDPLFVSQFLKQLPPAENFTVGLTDSNGAALFSVDGWRYLVMPLTRDDR